MIVHGERDPVSKKVQQRTLFVFYSRAEVVAALGELQPWFQDMLTEDHPNIRFDWKKLEAQLQEQLEVSAQEAKAKAGAAGDAAAAASGHAGAAGPPEPDGLPDLHPTGQARVANRFREALVGFTRELLVNDPQSLMSAARLLQAHAHELSYLQELIEWRRQLCRQEETQWNRDDPFHWRARIHRREVPAEAEEKLAMAFEQGEHERADALARLLIDCWPNYAEGHNYRGLIALDQREMVVARSHFERAMTVGRRLFPKRIRRDSWWADLATRPYMRALMNLAKTHGRTGDWEEALRCCDELEQVCGDKVTSGMERLAIYLGAGEWKEALRAVGHVHAEYPQTTFGRAFALRELGEEQRARAAFLHGALRSPRAAMMLCGLNAGKEPMRHHENLDHNNGVHSLANFGMYLGSGSHVHGVTRPRGLVTGAERTRLFASMLKSTAVKELIDEVEQARQQWFRRGPTADRQWLDRINEMESLAFAETRVQEMWPIEH